jgi:L-fuculose-phosphate aldolase
VGIEGLITELVHVGRSAVELGLTLASSGNLSARLPAEDRFIITTSGTWLDRLDANDFVEMTLQSDAADIKPQPSSEWKLHQRTYIERPDVNAVIHLHPQYTIILDALDIPIRLISMDHALYVRSIGRVDYLPSGSDELADSAGAVCRDHNCVILAFHGCSAVGDTIEMAYRRALNLEQAAQATYRTYLLGNNDLTFPPDHLERLSHALT